MLLGVIVLFLESNVASFSLIFSSDTAVVGARRLHDAVAMATSTVLINVVLGRAAACGQDDHWGVWSRLKVALFLQVSLSCPRLFVLLHPSTWEPEGRTGRWTEGLIARGSATRRSTYRNCCRKWAPLSLLGEEAPVRWIGDPQDVRASHYPAFSGLLQDGGGHMAKPWSVRLGTSLHLSCPRHRANLMLQHLTTHSTLRQQVAIII